VSVCVCVCVCVCESESARMHIFLPSFDKSCSNFILKTSLFLGTLYHFLRLVFLPLPFFSDVGNSHNN
jgi:hypothetical protein